MSEPFRDLHASIADVSQHYHFQELPGAISNMQEWITSAIRMIAEMIAKLLSITPAASDTRGFGDAMKWVWYIVGFLCFLAIVYVVISRTWQILRKNSSGTGGVSKSSRIFDSADWKKEASDLAAKADWRYGCRALYMSSLRKLDEAGVLSFGPSRTNYEYWYALQKEKTIQKLFREMANVIDESWFGNRNAGQSDFDNCSNLLAQIESEIGKRPASNPNK